MFSNNKPLFSKDLKVCLNDKSVAFLKGEMDQVKEKEKEFRRRVFSEKTDFKNKVEQRFCTVNAKQVWEGLNTMMGRERKKQSVNMADCGEFVNDLNIYYGRYDARDPRTGCSTICNQIVSYEPIQLSEREIAMCLSKIRPNIAPGPDGLRGRVLKVCPHQLKGVITQLFQTLLDGCIFPHGNT